MENIYALNRNNPDGTSIYWLWHNSKSSDNKPQIANQNYQNVEKTQSLPPEFVETDNYWWIGAVFKSATPSSLTDVNLLALKLERGPDGSFYYLKQNPTLLSNFTEFIDFFGENPNNYHPNEMTAKFAEWFLLDSLGDVNASKNYYNHKGYLIYKKYFENIITSYYN